MWEVYEARNFAHCPFPKTPEREQNISSEWLCWISSLGRTAPSARFLRYTDQGAEPNLGLAGKIGSDP